MADESPSNDDRTEEATPDRREEFRDRGQVVMSREFTSVAVLAACVIIFTAGAPVFLHSMRRLLVTHFEALATRRMDQSTIIAFLGEVWVDVLKLIVPIFAVTMVVSSVSTLLQTRFNWSWERLTPDFSRMAPLSGLMRMVNLQAVMELLKSTAKMVVVGVVAYLILKSEWSKVPELMAYPMQSAWAYWGGITRSLFWTVALFLLMIAAVDYFYNFMSHERQIKMTKQEVKQEFKNREGDQHMKNRMKRRARELTNRKTVAKTKTATVLVTNPTHYSIALKYEPGDAAPVLVAKGVDELALIMRTVAKEAKIPIIENRPLARELYATVKEGEEVPAKFYRVIAEIIRYVFKIKGKRLPVPRQRQGAAPDRPTTANLQNTAADPVDSMNLQPPLATNRPADRPGNASGPPNPSA